MVKSSSNQPVINSGGNMLWFLLYNWQA